MKKSISYFLRGFLVFSVVGCAIIYADVEWEGSNNPDVTDKNIKITGDVELSKGSNRIRAIKKNVLVRVSKDVSIRGNDDGPSRLYLETACGRKIRISIHNDDLDFIGSKTGDPLLIIQHGPGTVEFAIEGGSDVSFTKKNNSGGTQYWILMREPIFVCDEYGSDEYCLLQGSPNGDEYCSLPSTQGDEYCIVEPCDKIDTYEDPVTEFKPTLCFTRDDNSKSDRKKHVEIVIGKKSVISFLSSSKTGVDLDDACVKFDPSNTGSGRMILCIEDKGGLIVAGHKTKESDGDEIVLSDIDRTTAAGHNAIWRIINSYGPSSHSGLLVLNKNESLFDLLFDPFCTLGTRSSSTKWRGSFSGIRWGCVIGANGTLQVQEDSYLDYVGLALNQIPDIDSIPGFEDIDVEQLIKKRNPSALFIDGNHNPSSTLAHIEFSDRAAAVFRSGIAGDGSVRGINKSHPFTIDPMMRTRNIVFDVEGRLDVHGANIPTVNKIELLSREVTETGSSVLASSTETNFPARTFDKDEDGEPRQYNCGVFLINNCMNMHNTHLVHTDQCHSVFQKNDTRSQPAYVGGETFKLKEEDDLPRPKIAFLNSFLHVHTNIASTGVDFVTPNLVEDGGICTQNVSKFIFYHNGFGVDDGTGRQMVLGTHVGSKAADGCTRINCDSHLDVIQLENCFDRIDSFDPLGNHTLVLISQPNSIKVVEEIGDTNKHSIHTIFLGCNSNISIGDNKDKTGFDIDTNPWLRIDGNFFSFESAGGPLRRPATTNVTGKGGIFVDLNGRLTVGSDFRASFSTQITKSRDGMIELSKQTVYFDDGIGIADWRLNLNDLQVVVPSNMCLSDYVLNWIATTKNTEDFCPYEIGDVTICECPTVTQKNIAELPTFEGIVDQLQIQASRFGDPIHIMINGGHVRELVFQSGTQSGQAPVAVIVLKENGRVGLGPTHTSKDSICASTTLGVNGISIIADGDGRVDLNEDMEINNICAFLKGPNFEGDTLEICSSVPREIRIKPTGTLDLRTFDSEFDEIKFCGDIRLSIEPGGRILMGGGVLIFADNVKVIFEPVPNVIEFFDEIPHGAHDNELDPLAVVDAALPHNEFASHTNFGNGLRNTDPFRVRIIGEGTIEFKDNAFADIPFGAFVGVETLSEGECEITNTDITLNLLDNAEFRVGFLDVEEGGVFQIGNIEDFGPEHSVSFTLTLNGNNADFIIGRQGFVGLGVGLVGYLFFGEDFTPNTWLVDTTFNVENTITFNWNDGQFKHDRIFSGDNTGASLMAINSAAEFNLNIETAGDEADDVGELRVSNFNAAGGGNIVEINPGAGSLHPIVRTDDDEVFVGIDDDGTGLFHSRMRVGIMASTLLQDLLENESELTGDQFFDDIKTHDAVIEFVRPNTISRANAAALGESFRGPRELRIGTVANGDIVRITDDDVLGSAGSSNDRIEKAIENGAVFVTLGIADNAIIQAAQIH